MARMPGVPFMPPRSWSMGRPEGPPRFIVIHYTAGSEGPTAAEDGVRYDQARADGTSTHFFVDRDSIIQCVDTDNRSHTALWHGNLWGIHIEQCGTAQSRAQWLDEASRATIRNAAKVAAWAMRVHDIPLVRLVGRDVRTGRGICGHVDCTTGFPEDGGTHTDPGPEYPWDVLFADIRAELEGDDVSLTADESRKLNEIHRLLYEGKRLNDPQTSGGGIPIAWIVRMAQQLGADIEQVYGEVDSLEESDAQILALVQAIQAGDPQAIAEALAVSLPPAIATATADVLRDRLSG